MNAIAKVQMTVPQFLDWAAARRARLPYDEAKWELFDGIPEMQDHERWSHAKAKIAIYLAVRAAVAKSGLALEVAIDSVGVEIAPNATYRPEVVVFPAGEIADDDRLAPDPIVVVEVLSPSSANKDLRIKAEGYGRVATIQHYLVADPDACTILHYRREGQQLVPPQEAIGDGKLLLDPPGMPLDVADCFRS